MSRRPGETFLPAALLFLCLGAFFLVYLPKTLVDEGPRSLLSSFDLESYFLPRYWLGSQEIRLGQLPVWNRYEYGGIPLLATAQPAALYPPKVLLFGILPPVAALWAFLVVHFILATLGFLWFLRDQGLRGAGLFVGTAIWIFGQPMLASNYHPVRIACLSWMPLLFVFGIRIAAGAGIGAFAMLALVVTLQLFAGYPEFTIDICLLLGTYVIVRWYQGGAAHPPPWKTVPILAGAFVLGGVAAGLQLVPLVEVARVARRVAVAAGEATKFDEFLARADWASLPVLPRSLPVLDGTSLGMLGPGVARAPIAVVPTLMVFALIGFFLRSAGAAAVCYAICQIFIVGAWHVLRFLPGFSMVRFPLTWAPLALFCFASVAAFGSDATLRSDALGAGARRGALCAVAATSIAISVTAVLAWRAGSVAPFRPGKLAAIFANNIGGSAPLVLAILGALLIAALALLERVERSPPAWTWLTAFFLATLAHIAAFPYGAARASFGPPLSTGEVASIHAGHGAIAGRVLAPTDLSRGYEITDRLPSALGVEDSFLPWRSRQIRDRLGFVSFSGSIDWNQVAGARGFWNAMNVQYFLAPTSMTSLFTSHGFRSAHQAGDKTLFENPLRLGDAWVSYAVHPIRSEREALDYVMGSRFDPYREVVIEAPTRHAYPTTTSEPVTIPARGTRFSSTEVEFDVDLPRAGMFVVSESAYPGWIATVDGARQPWLTANYVLRAVELEAGAHRVRFEYRPASLRWGAALTGVGVSGIISLLIIAHRRRAVTRLSA